MAIIQTACTCGTKVEIRTGVDSGSSFRADGKQAVYPGERGYCIFRCRDCRMPLHETVPEYAFEEPGHTTNKPGAVTQQPLYGCTSCHEDYSWPAEDLRVHDSECWCDTCWDGRSEEFPDQPSWNDLEPYTPALQAECEKLVEALEDISVTGPNEGTAWLNEIAYKALAAHRKQGGG